jgi:hypothetical protein
MELEIRKKVLISYIRCYETLHVVANMRFRKT